MEIKPIAYFHSPFPTKFGVPRQAGLARSLRGKIVFEPAFRSREAVRGLKDFEYLWLIWGFSANVKEDRPGKEPSDKTSFKATVRPPRLGGNERVGVFASRSPFRPNPLGLSSVKLVSVDHDARDSDGKPCGPVIEVEGADLMDMTPVYDIKPYVEYADSHPGVRSGFVDTHDKKTLEVLFPPEAYSSGLDLAVLSEVLSLDPRPSYHDDPSKVYGMYFGGHEVKFRVEGNVLKVEGIE